MNDTDWKIYWLFDRCAAAGLPILFCGDDPSRKWELIEMLKDQLATKIDARHEQEL